MKQASKRWPAVLIALLLLTAGVAWAEPVATMPSAPVGDAAAKQVVDEDQWFRVYFGKALVGWARSISTHTPGALGAAGGAGKPDDAVYDTKFEFHFTIDRGGFQTRLAVESTFFESGDGRPIRSLTKKLLGQYEVEEQMFFRGERGDAGVDLFTKQLGVMRHELLPAVLTRAAREAGGEKWVGAREAERIVREAMKRGDKRVAVWTLEPTEGAKVVHTITTYEGETEIDVGDQKIKTRVWRQEVEGRPAQVLKLYTDANGTALQLEQTVSPGMVVRMVTSDASAATAKVEKMEFMAASLVKAGSPIKDARNLRRGVFTIESGGGKDEKISVVTTGSQRMSRVDVEPGAPGDERAKPQAAEGVGRYRVEVDLDKPVWISEGDPDWPTDDNRKAASMLDFEDAPVAALVKSASKNFKNDSPAEKARVLRAFVFRHISTKDYSVGFASASEVARTQRGDCTEHGVLLAALLRGAGVPSRVATGLVYAPEVEKQHDVFVYHMWAQAWVEQSATESPDGKHRGRWMDVDATLPNERLFDAAHIILGVSSMSATTPVEDDPSYKLAAMGRVRMSVVEPK
jgi:hypothetical protein